MGKIGFTNVLDHLKNPTEITVIQFYSSLCTCE